MPRAGSMGTPEECAIQPHRSLTHGSLPVRELKFRSRFLEIPRQEKLLKYIPCVWRKDIGRNLRGGLYLSENHFLFYCASKRVKESEQQRKLLIEIVDVLVVTKERSLSIFPDSVGLETVSGEKYVFSQLFARNAVYKILCRLCDLHPSSRRSSMDPFIGKGSLGGGDFDDEDDDDDCDVDSAAKMRRRDDHSHSSSPSTSSSLSTTPPDLKRTLSVVREVSHEESEPIFSHSAPGRLMRSSSRKTDMPHGDMDDLSWSDRQLLPLLRLIVGVLLLTAAISVYQIATRSFNVVSAPSVSLDQSLGDFSLASQSVMQVAEEARTFLSAFAKDEMRVAK